MDKAYSILMFCFSACLFLYAGLLALTRDVGLVPKTYAAKIKNKKEYAKGIAKVVALTALAPLISGVVALFGDMDRMVLPALLVLIAGFIVFIYLGVKRMKKHQDLT